MRKIHRKGLFSGKIIIIGDSYAKDLGYIELVGAMGVIDNVLNALCGVSLLTGPTELVGKQIDIHKEDCLDYNAEKKSIEINHPVKDKRNNEQTSIRKIRRKT